MPKNILAIETATAVCSVALRANGLEPRELRQTGKGIHSEMVFVFTEELLTQTGLALSDLDGIVLSAGPGSYTGLRVGSSAVKGMLFGSSLIFYAANTLAGIAVGAKKIHPQVSIVHAVLDARRKHLYHQAFRFEQNQPVSDEDSSIKPLAGFNTIIHKGDLIAGTGITRLPEDLYKNTPTLGEEIISALNLIELFDQWATVEDASSTATIKKVAPESFEPYY